MWGGRSGSRSSPNGGAAARLLHRLPVGPGALAGAERDGVALGQPPQRLPGARCHRHTPITTTGHPTASPRVPFVALRRRRGRWSVMRMRLEPEDDYFHAPDDDPNYNESRYYNFFDPDPRARRVGAHGEPPQRGLRGDDRVPLPARRARRVHVQAAATSTATTRTTPAGCGSRWWRRTRSTTSPTTARCACSPTRARWPTPGRRSRSNPHEPCAIDLRRHRGRPTVAAANPSGTRARSRRPGRRTASRGPHRAADGDHRGRRRSASSSFDLDAGLGLRDHSWGPRVWQSIWWYRWLTASFGPLGIACTLRGERDADGRNVSGYVFDVEQLRRHTAWCRCATSTLTSEYDDEGFVRAQRRRRHHRRPRRTSCTATCGRASRCATVATAR